MEIADLVTRQREKLSPGESAVTLHTLEGSGYYLSIIDEHSGQLMALTEEELKQVYKLLNKKYNELD